MPHAATSTGTELEQAFRAFNQRSLELEASYRELESRVALLNKELAAARSERFQELVEKERLAGRLEQLLEALPGAVVVLDGSGLVQECNPGAAAMLGKPLIGELWCEVAERAFTQLGEMDGELTLRNGGRISVSKRSLLIEPGQILLLTDVTETRRLQEALGRKERLSSMGETAASLAHQIRTPLASAMLYASHLGGRELPERERQRFAAKVLTRLRHLDRMINDMLVFARGGRAGAGEIPVGELLKDVASALEPQLSDEDCITIDVGPETESLTGHFEALTGALLNLANNAVEAAEGRARVRLEAHLEGPDQLVLVVEDDGHGMTPETAARAFDPFFTTRPDGTGLGLAVVRSIAMAHGGDAWVESTPGVGSIFGIRVPIKCGQDALPSSAGCMAEGTHTT